MEGGGRDMEDYCQDQLKQTCPALCAQATYQTLLPPQTPNGTNPQLRSHDPGLTYLLYTALTRRLALHDIGHLAKGDAIPDDTRNSRAAVVEGNVQVDVLHRVLYPQVHVNGIKKKKKRFLIYRIGP